MIVRLVFLAALMAASSSLAAPHEIDFTLHNFHFDQFDVDGFSAPGVTHAVFKDSSGRVWIGTDSGLFLFDGHEVRSFEHKTGSSEGLPNPFVKAIVETSDGTVWIGTWGGGLAYYDNTTHVIRRAKIAHGPGEPFDGRIWTMAVDQKDRLWLGSFNSGLYRYDPDTQTLENAYQMADGEDKRGNRISAVITDSQGRIWFAPFRNGIRVIDAESMQSALERTQLVDKNVSDIAPLGVDRMLIAGWHGVQVLDMAGKSVTQMEVTPKTSNETIMRALSYGKSAVLIGTAGGNLWHVDIENRLTTPIPVGHHTGAMEPSIVWSMQISDDGTIMIGGTTGVWLSAAGARQFWTISGLDESSPVFFTESRALLFDGGYLYANSGTDLYRLRFDGSFSGPKRLTGVRLAETLGNRPLWLEESEDGQLWVATDNGVLTINRLTGETRFAINNLNVQNIFHGRSGELLVDAKKRLVDLRNEDSASTIARLMISPSDVPRLTGNHLGEGMHDDIWVGTFSGLERFSYSSREPLPAFADEAETNNWNNTYVTFTYPVSKDELLVGSLEGVWKARLNASGKIERLELALPEQPFGASAFDAVVKGPDDLLYFFGEPGLVEYNVNSHKIRTLSVDEGMPEYGIYSAGYHQWPGLAMLSGQNGPLLFNPDQLDIRDGPRELRITGITSFRDNATSTWPVKKSGLEFKHTDRVIRFKFGLLDFFNSLNDRYAIRLVGFQEDWLDIGSLKEFSFTNLDAGNYRLEVRVTEGSTGKQAESSISFSVLPPWWLTWWAYALYAFIIAGALFWFWYAQQRKIERERDVSTRLREADRIKSHFLNELEEKVVEATQDLRHAVEALEIKNVELDAAQQRALDASRLKSEFLANMSHEIRTPMNGVLGFTRLLQKSPLGDEQKDYVDTIEKSAHSLLGIINDVLDVSKIEAGKLIIDSVGFDLRQCLSDTIDALAPVAYDKDLELLGHVDADLPDGLRGDPVRIRQMVTNLLGNGLKFTDSGYVKVHVQRARDDNGRDWLQIEVNDTGRGIGAAGREKLFQAFEQGNIELSSRQVGTGLGLVITKKLCEAMGGSISLESEPGEGTCVRLRLPLVVDRNPENRYGFGTPLKGKRLLLVDPLPETRAALEARYAHWGAEVDARAELPQERFVADLAIISVPRTALGDVASLCARVGQLPSDLPRLCLASTIDHEVMRSIADACGAACVSKAGHKKTQLRHVLRLLNLDWEQNEESESDNGKSALAGLHVLVADDNRINRYFLKKMLELHGARVTEADSGNAVLERMAQDSFDLALLDVHMPDMDGLEVARRIRADGNKRLPLLAVSANVQPQTYEAALAAGINDYLLKPVEENKLVEAVLEWTGREETA